MSLSLALQSMPVDSQLRVQSDRNNQQYYGITFRTKNSKRFFSREKFLMRCVQIDTYHQPLRALYLYVALGYTAQRHPSTLHRLNNWIYKSSFFAFDQVFPTTEFKAACDFESTRRLHIQIKDKPKLTTNEAFLLTAFLLLKKFIPTVRHYCISFESNMTFFWCL